jgi:hypothetical protein
MLLLYINLLFFKYAHMFHHKSKGKRNQSDNPSSSRHGWARQLTCL